VARKRRNGLAVRDSPQTNRIIPSASGQSGAVGAKSQACDGYELGVTKGAQGLAIGDPPEASRVIAAPGRKGSTIGTKSLSQNGDRHLAADVHSGEEPHLLGASPHFGIGSKDNAVHRHRMAFQCAEQSAVGEAPEPNGLITACTA